MIYKLIRKNNRLFIESNNVYYILYEDESMKMITNMLFKKFDLRKVIYEY